MGDEDAAAEAIMLAGGARAILLQLANPGVGHGVAAHSDFARRPLDRLHGTLTYLYVIRYGTPDEVRTIARHVGRAHGPVRGEGYDARDVDLQLWVAATIHDTAMRMHAMAFGGPGASGVDPATAQQMLDEAAAVATTLGVPREKWPATPAEFERYWNSSCDRLRVDDVARGVARELLHPVAAPVWMRMLLPTVRTVTAGLLSPELRDAYGLVHDERRFARFEWLARNVYPRLPRWLRHAPKRRYLRAFRAARVAAPVE